MTKAPNPHSKLGFACAVQGYADDASNLPGLPGDAFLKARAPNGGASLEMFALARAADRERDLWRRTYRTAARERLEKAGAPAEWLRSAGASDYLDYQCELLRPFWGLELSPRDQKQPAIWTVDGRDRFRRGLVVKVMAGAFFAHGGSCADAARALNVGLPKGSAGITPYDVRNAVDPFWKDTMALHFKASAPTDAMIAAEVAALEFEAGDRLWRAHEMECLADPVALFRTLVDSGRLLDLRTKTLDSIPTGRRQELRTLALRGSEVLMARKAAEADKAAA